MQSRKARRAALAPRRVVVQVPMVIKSRPKRMPRQWRKAEARRGAILNGTLGNPFNEKMFWFNREVLDRFVLKPVATAWDFVLPTPVQKGVHNVFDNLAVVRRW